MDEATALDSNGDDDDNASTTSSADSNDDDDVVWVGSRQHDDDKVVLFEHLKRESPTSPWQQLSCTHETSSARNARSRRT